MRHIKLREKTDITNIQSVLDNKFKYEFSSHGLRILGVKSDRIDICLSEDGLNIFILDRLPTWLNIGIGAVMLYVLYLLPSLNNVSSDYSDLLMPAILIFELWFLVNTLVKKAVFSHHISGLSDALVPLTTKSKKP